MKEQEIREQLNKALQIVKDCCTEDNKLRAIGDGFTTLPIAHAFLTIKVFDLLSASTSDSSTREDTAQPSRQ